MRYDESSIEGRNLESNWDHEVVQVALFTMVVFMDSDPSFTQGIL
jgi:hypothetical protein